ncbi:Ccaat-box DNA binding protein subunit B, related, related, partial [Eimeria tenella]
GFDEEEPLEAAAAAAAERVSFCHLSSAIEGATKVYGYRVEAVYDQTYHLLNGLSSLKNSSNGVEDDEEQQQQQQQQGSKRKQRQQQQQLALFFKGGSSTLADPQDILNEQQDTGVLIDPFFV